MISSTAPATLLEATWLSNRLLRPINESLSGALVLCMSACEGYFAGTMAMEEEPLPHPFYAMVGNSKKPTWSDTAVSYLAFYHLIAKGRLFGDAVAAMNAVSGDDGWVLHTADELKTSYLEHLRAQEIEPAQARHQLEAVANRQQPTIDAKELEGGG